MLILALGALLSPSWFCCLLFRCAFTERWGYLGILYLNRSLSVRKLNPQMRTAQEMLWLTLWPWGKDSGLLFASQLRVTGDHTSVSHNGSAGRDSFTIVNGLRSICSLNSTFFVKLILPASRSQSALTLVCRAEAAPALLPGVQDTASLPESVSPPRLCTLQRAVSYLPMWPSSVYPGFSWVQKLRALSSCPELFLVRLLPLWWGDCCPGPASLSALPKPCFSRLRKPSGEHLLN